MKQSVQNKIDKIIANSSAVQSLKGLSIKENVSREDSLLKAIRSKEDASMFIAELDAAIKVAQSK